MRFGSLGRKYWIRHLKGGCFRLILLPILAMLAIPVSFICQTQSQSHYWPIIYVTDVSNH